MQLVINGQVKEFPSLSGNATVSELVAHLGLKSDRVAIEQNGEIIPRSCWDSAPVQSGDKLEIVHFVGGGLPTGSLP
ncbi:MAG: sulfur carrier protein ThiS [Acidobacterium ailaaui]|jgi:thiamine biosynthesis protein ThiS|nr:sulfur carrier protein ThiS [Pseudacidobacterium ailaaui]MBX6359451.1 sulfur carrier protein ThiS [Pseudacidobacterium ailaaui]MCL6463578.1 sulfur carrier protein ThiS [Pseudacidobacterium ailaaui]MDI3254416.1 sulfur carrier protein ThiS [Bacillota bacterium]